MKLGFLYAGQGSQHPGMGADLYRTKNMWENGADYESICEAANIDIEAPCWSTATTPP